MSVVSHRVTEDQLSERFPVKEHNFFFLSIKQILKEGKKLHNPSWPWSGVSLSLCLSALGWCARLPAGMAQTKGCWGRHLDKGSLILSSLYYSRWCFQPLLLGVHFSAVFKNSHKWRGSSVFSALCAWERSAGSRAFHWDGVDVRSWRSRKAVWWQTWSAPLCSGRVNYYPELRP